MRSTLINAISAGFCLVIAVSSATVYADPFTLCVRDNNGRLNRGAFGETPAKGQCKSNKWQPVTLATEANVIAVADDLAALQEHILIDFVNTAIGVNAFINHTTGVSNTALGAAALQENTTGGFNTAVGDKALRENLTGAENTAVGDQALRDNTTGLGNTAVGAVALSSNTDGTGNTALGLEALLNNMTGINNTAGGIGALDSNVTGSANVAFGLNALGLNAAGNLNTAVGPNALASSTGSRNIGIGSMAGGTLVTGDDNVYISNSIAVGAESGTIRIGMEGTQTATFVAGIFGVDVGGGGTQVFVNADGQLGTVASSRRFKKDIEDMDNASSALMKLRPVTFRYKNQATSGLEYGLIAEEVAQIYPELVVYSKSGAIQTVQYHKLSAMLLNEMQKQHRQSRAQKQELEELRAQNQKLQEQYATLKGRLAQLEVLAMTDRTGTHPNQ